MAIGAPAVLYTASEADTSTDRAFVVTLTAGAAIGDTVFVFHGTDAGVTTPASPPMALADSSDNAYTVDQPFLRNTTGGTVMILAASATVTAALVAGDTITLTNTSSDWGASRRSTVVCAVSGLAASARLDQSATANPGSSSALSVGPTAATDTADEIAFALWGSGVRDFTPGTGWTLLSSTATAEGSANRRLSVQYRTLDSVGAQTAAASFSSATTNVGALLTYRATADVAPPAARLVRIAGVYVPVADRQVRIAGAYT